MKKTTVLLITVLFMIIGYAAYNATINIYGNALLAENISDFKVYLSNLKVNGTEVDGINETKDEFTIEDINGDISVDIVNDSTEYDTDAYLECVKEDENVGKVWNYDYTGGEQTFTVPITGTYKLKVWGAQGGSYSSNYPGGYGAYSVGTIALKQGGKIYINVGGIGGGNGNHVTQIGGYNGGGTATIDSDWHTRQSSGGGLTHISFFSGALKYMNLSELQNLLLVAGGGGGSAANAVIMPTIGGSGGGYIGGSGENYSESTTINGTGYGGTQTTSPIPQYGSGVKEQYYSIGGFGYGADGIYAGGGGGFYGGSVSVSSAGGGSGYIGNTLLTEKAMYCYNCPESNEVSTKTISTTCVDSNPTAACAKSGNGYAKITLLSAPINESTDKLKIEAKKNINQSIKNLKSKSLTCKLKVNKISRSERIYSSSIEWKFDYTGGEQTFTAPVSGTYKLETWGAQGGSRGIYTGGYGGYSNGSINLKQNTNLYINIGGKGKVGDYTGGYNGGGSFRFNQTGFGSSGGGASHIALSSGLLVNLETKVNNILLVSGGGGGADSRGDGYGDGNGGSGGGFVGNNGETVNHSQNYGYGYGTGGTQTIGGTSIWIELTSKIDSTWVSTGIFGSAGIPSNESGPQSGGGGGFYGGGGGNHGGSGGGSGYIGNSLLSEKAMYCYNCEESSEENTKTISTTCVSENPTANCAKQGNGYARITLVSID